MPDTPTPPATRAQQEAEIREACARANPEIDGMRCETCGVEKPDATKRGHWCTSFSDEASRVFRPIRLADVLLAVKAAHDIPADKVFLDAEEMAQSTKFFVFVTQIIELWNLRSDDLSLQSDATIDFLFDLLP